MKRIKHILLACLLTLVVPDVLRAQSFSAGIYERFITPSFYDFGSEGAARLQRHIFDSGIRRVTANLRIAYRAQREQFYLPSLRSSRLAVEDFITMTSHYESEVVLRPILVADVGAEVAAPLPIEFHGEENIQRIVSSLKRVLGVYASAMRDYRVEELVFPAVLDLFLTKNNLQYLSEIERFLRYRSGFGTYVMSLEMTSAQVEKLKKLCQEMGVDVVRNLLSGFARVRLKSDQGVDGSLSTDFILQDLQTLQAILPNMSWALADVEVVAEDLDKAKHAGSMSQLLTQIEEIEQGFGESRAYYELKYGMTHIEPESWLPYRNFFVWNPRAVNILRKKIRQYAEGAP